MENDKRIMDLRADIKAKQDKLKKVDKFKPVTNCMISYGMSKTSLNVLSSDNLKALAIRLHVDIKAQKELGFIELKHNGFTLEEWKTDVLNKITILDKEKELKELKVLEDKLETLLSHDKKTELAIDEIANLINK